MKLLCEKIDRTKTGTNSKTGEVFKKIGVYANGKWYSCGQNRDNALWKEGDEIDVEVKEVKTSDGRSFWNIVPSHKNSPAMDELLATVKRIEEKLDNVLKGTSLALHLRSNYDKATFRPYQDGNSRLGGQSFIQSLSAYTKGAIQKRRR